MKTIQLTRGLTATVDDEDYGHLASMGRWHAEPSRGTHYARRNFRLEDGRYRLVQMHTVLTSWPLVDHINGDGLDNRRANLRPATGSQNAMNKRIRSDNTTGFKGVKRRRQRDGRPADRWEAVIYVGGRRVSLGNYTSPIAAAEAYDAGALEHFGEFARINFPNGAAA